MAVLSKIRQRSFLVIAIVGIALFAFIIGALIENGGFNQTNRNIGTVNGVDIPFEEFRAKVDNVTKGQQTSITQASNSIWEQEVRSALMSKQYEKVGLLLADDQLINVFKDDQNFNQQFPQVLNAAGKFDKAKFNEFVSSIKKSNPEQWQNWLDYEKNMANYAIDQMYNTMLKGGVYNTTADAKFNYEFENNKITFDYVAVPYSTIDDKKVELTDSEVLAFMKKNEKKYKAEASRELEVVLVEDKPSVADEKAIKDKVNALLNASIVYNAKSGKNDTLPGFKSTSNVIEFVNANSDVKYDSTYIAKKDLPVEHQEALYNLPAGTVYGPYMNGTSYCLTRSLGKKAGANAKASHILLSYKEAMRSSNKRTKAEAQAKANELFAQALANPASLPMLALTNSDDGSKQNGGDLGYFSKGQMTKKFEDFAFNNPVGKIGLVETEFGFHIINVTDKQDAVRLATIAQKIGPSEITSDANYTKATKFEILANEKAFDVAAKEMKLTVLPVAKVLALDENVQGIPSAQRDIVKWAFSADKDDVKRFNVATGHAIVRVKNSYTKGLLPIEEAKIAVGAKIRNEKKAVLIREKMKGATLEAVSKATGSPVKEAKDVAGSGAFIESVGPEAKVVGKAFKAKAGQVSDKIDGNSGVFMIKVKSSTKAPILKDFKDMLSKLNGQSKGMASQRVYTSLKEAADIEDNRVDFN